MSRALLLAVLLLIAPGYAADQPKQEPPKADAPKAQAPRKDAAPLVDPQVTINVPGAGEITMFLDPKDTFFTPMMLAVKGPWETGETHWFVKSIKPGDVVVDLGAYVGYYTLIAGKLVGDKGKVYAFEPGPDAFALLQKNVRVNHLTNVVLEHKAVSDKPGSIKLFVSEKHSADNKIYKSADDPTRPTVDIEAVSLDDYFRSRDHRVDFVKMDVQGAEGLILDGMHQVLSWNPHLRMVVEFTPEAIKQAGSDPYAGARYLKEAGFRFFDIGAADGPRALTEADPIPILERLSKKYTGTTNFYLTRNPGPRNVGLNDPAP
jgi:FkbM family methyltransferase